MAALAGAFSRSWGGAQAGAVAGRASLVQSNEGVTVWLVGMRYRSSTPKAPRPGRDRYTRREDGDRRDAPAALGVSQSQRGASASTRCAALVQKSVWEIDSKYK